MYNLYILVIVVIDNGDFKMKFLLVVQLLITQIWNLMFPKKGKLRILFAASISYIRKKPKTEAAHQFFIYYFIQYFQARNLSGRKFVFIRIVLNSGG